MELSVITLKEVANEAGVSVITASRILNGQTKGLRRDATLRATRVLKVAKRLGYQPNASARAMRNNRSPHIGVLVCNNPTQVLDDRFHNLAKFESILGINHSLTACGYVVSIIKISDIGTSVANTSRVFRERILEGMIVMDPLPGDLFDFVNQLLPNRCVWFDASWQPERCVTRDEVDAGRTTAERLIDLGYRNIVYVGEGNARVPKLHYSGVDRFTGAQQACRRAGVNFDVLDTLTPMCVGLDREKHAADAAIRLFRRDVAALAYDVFWARWLSHFAASVHKCPAYDFGLAVADDNYDNSVSWPGLSRYSISRYEMGTQAADLLLQLLEHPDQPCVSRVLRGRWIPGNTAWGPQFDCRRLESQP